MFYIRVAVWSAVVALAYALVTPSAFAAYRIRCESEQYGMRHCPVDTPGRVSVARQLSQAECRYGEEWGYDRHGIWVKNGCAAEFEISPQYVRDNDRSYALPMRGRGIRCESQNYEFNRCPADTRGGVRLREQLSATDCRQGDNWGYDRRGVWVDNGCAAEFQVGRQYAWDDNDRFSYAPNAWVIRCESENYEFNRCPADTRDGVRLRKQLSETDCRQGDNWGYDRRGVWVDDGCSGEFQISSRS